MLCELYKLGINHHPSDYYSYLDDISITEEELGADLLADDLGPDEVLLGQTQPHLL